MSLRKQLNDAIAEANNKDVIISDLGLKLKKLESEHAPCFPQITAQKQVFLYMCICNIYLYMYIWALTVSGKNTTLENHHNTTLENHHRYSSVCTYAYTHICNTLYMYIHTYM